MSDDQSDAERVYPIRITGPAAEDVEQAVSYLSALTGTTLADDWEDGFYEAVRTLSRLPRKHPLAERESRHFGVEVRLLHVRHSARRPISRAEVQERLRAIEKEP